MIFTTIFGFIIGFGLLFLVFFLQKGLGYFVNWPALAITLGGTLSATMIFFSYHGLRNAVVAFLHIFSETKVSPKVVIDVIVELCKKARTTEDYNSLLESESVGKIPFLKRALSFVADGATPEQAETVLKRESHSISERNRIGERVFRIAGSFAPMFGMMGTVIGLIIMLNTISDPKAIPAAMGLALVTTLYGLILAALICKPISGKIRDKNQTDTRVRDIIIEGVLSMQRGENSQIIKERLLTYLN